MNTKLLTFTLVLTSFLTTTSFAEMYKWKDEAGVIHYAQLPPVGVSHEVLGDKGKIIDSKAAKKESKNAKEEDYDPSEEVLEIMAKNKADQALKEVNSEIEAEKLRIAKANEAQCEVAKSNLISLESRPIVRISENGKTRILSKSEKESQIETNRKNVKDFCK